MTTRIAIAALLSGALYAGAATAAIQTAPPLILAAPDVESVLAQDARTTGVQPYRFAVPIAVLVTPATHGTWTLLDTGELRWTVTVSVPGAKHLNFGFTELALPPGAKLAVSAPDGSDLRAPHSSRTSGPWWTPVVRADTAIIRLTVPAARRSEVVLHLTRVNSGFRGFGAKDETSQAKSGACNVDVACPAGDAWRDESRSVARISINGLFLCSGTMLNNTAEDFTPYFLTAAHCVTTPTDAPGVVFYWNYQTSVCNGRPDGKLDHTQSGSTYAAGAAKSDFTLLRLDQKPDPAFQVYYSGWDHRDVAWENVTGIHHPSGDEKRIAQYFGQTEITGTAPLIYSEPDDIESEAGAAANPVFLMIPAWDVGVTEAGSSGSGLWNADHRVVGQLSGGGAACSGTRNNGRPDWYGRVHSDWHDLPTPLTSLASHLDKAGTGAEFLDGKDPNGIYLNPPANDAKSGNGALAGASGGFTILGLVGLLLMRRYRQGVRRALP
jgi:lysyl endopeptidase